MNSDAVTAPPPRQYGAKEIGTIGILDTEHGGRGPTDLTAVEILCVNSHLTVTNILEDQGLGRAAGGPGAGPAAQRPGLTS